MAHLLTEALKHPLLQAAEDIEEKVGNKMSSWEVGLNKT